MSHPTTDNVSSENLNAFSRLELKENAVPNVLCLDGGGFRGILQVKWLRGLPPRVLQDLSGVELFIGTSIGGIISIILAKYLSVDPVNGLPRALDKLIEIFSEELKKPNIFADRWFSSLKAYNYSWYDHDKLKPILEKELKKEDGKPWTLGDLRKSVLVTSFNVRTSKPVTFKTWDDEQKDLSLIDICMCTSAAPIYFPLYNMNKNNEKVNQYIDGGVWCNNPTIELLEYDRIVDGIAKKLKKLSVWSIGTGYYNRTKEVYDRDQGARFWFYKGTDNWFWGRKEHLKILQVMFDGQSKRTHKIISKIAKSFGWDYVRVNFELDKEYRLNDPEVNSIDPFKAARIEN